MSEIYELLTINAVTIPNTESGFSVEENDNYNTYEGEDGSKTVELIRSGVLSLSVQYRGLLESDMKTIKGALKTVSTVEFREPTTGEVKTMQCLISDVKRTQQFYKDGISIWGLTFNIEEL